MKRWLFASFAVASLALLTGCTPQDTALNEKNSSVEAPRTEEPKTEEPKVEEPKATPENVPVSSQPKDGENVAVLDTSMGKIVIMFYPDRAPRHVDNFMNLAKSGFYSGTRFHRCMPGFMIQGGDPKSKDLSKSGEWGTGGNMVDGKEKTVQAEFNDIHHARGIVSMARSPDPNSASSQFFIMVAENGGLDGEYSAFGLVVKGMDVADKIVATGPTDQALNGSVEPKKAVVLKSVKIEKWPVK